jgi:hypothetical protein
VLAAACRPDSLVPPSTGVAGADDVITTAPEPVPSPDTADGWATRDWPPDQSTADPWSDAADDMDGAWTADTADSYDSCAMPTIPPTSPDEVDWEVSR